MRLQHDFSALFEMSCSKIKLNQKFDRGCEINNEFKEHNIRYHLNDIDDIAGIRIRSKKNAHYHAGADFSSGPIIPGFWNKIISSINLQSLSDKNLSFWQSKLNKSLH